MSDFQTHFLVVCPSCSSTLRIKRKSAGKEIQCKACNHAFVAIDAGNLTTPDSGFVTAPLPQPVEPDERIVATCPNCQALLRVRRAYIGNYVRCKQCEHKFLVMAPEQLEQKPQPL